MSLLGIDIGGTKVALRAENSAGASYDVSFRWPEGRPDDAPGEGFARDVAELSRRLAPAPGSRREPVTAVGVALPALLDAEGRVAAWPGRPSWEGARPLEALAGLFPRAGIVWADDGDLAALAEAEAAGCADLLYIGVGTGIGGGVICGGRPLPGPGLGSCEVGHVVVDHSGGQRCDCGRLGCVQALASGPATLRRAAELRGGPVEFAALRDGVAAGAPWAVGALEPAVRALAALVVSVAELTRPRLALIGGGFAAGVPDLVPRVEDELARLARPGMSVPVVRRAALGGLSSLSGAVALARRTVSRGHGADQCRESVMAGTESPSRSGGASAGS